MPAIKTKAQSIPQLVNPSGINMPAWQPYTQPTVQQKLYPPIVNAQAVAPGSPGIGPNGQYVQGVSIRFVDMLNNPVNFIAVTYVPGVLDAKFQTYPDSRRGIKIALERGNFAYIFPNG